MTSKTGKFGIPWQSSAWGSTLELQGAQVEKKKNGQIRRKSETTLGDILQFWQKNFQGNMLINLECIEASLVAQ